MWLGKHCYTVRVEPGPTVVGRVRHQIRALVRQRQRDHQPHRKLLRFPITAPIA